MLSENVRGDGADQIWLDQGQISCFVLPIMSGVNTFKEGVLSGDEGPLTLFKPGFKKKIMR